jgi:hypothetical protein
MQVHHPRLVKRRYLLLNPALRHTVPTFQPSVSSFGLRWENFIIFFFSTGNTFRYQFGLHEAEQKKEKVS